MSTKCTSRRTDKEQVDVLTESGWRIPFFSKPRTSVTRLKAGEDNRETTRIEWTTSDSALLAKFHDAIVNLIDQQGKSGPFDAVRHMKQAKYLAQKYGGSWRDQLKKMAGGGPLPLPDEVLDHVKSFA